MNSGTTKRLLPWLIAVAFLMESLDTTILNTAVPTIATALAVASLSMKSVLSSYTLSLAVFIPISGWMADQFEQRQFHRQHHAADVDELWCCRRLAGYGHLYSRSLPFRWRADDRGHKAFLVLGLLTIGSALVFRELEEGDGNSVSQQATRSCDGVNVRYLPSMRKVVLATADKAEVQLGCLSRWGQSPANCSVTFWSREIIIQKICGVY